MESDVTTAPLLSDDEHGVEQSFSDTLDKLCTYYMALGVSYDEFWNGDYTMLKFYVERHKIAVEQKNEELWLQGLYFYEAVCTALSNAFSKGSKAKYPEEKEAENKAKVDEFRAQLMAIGRRLEAKHKREQGGENLGS